MSVRQSWVRIGLSRKQVLVFGRIAFFPLIEIQAIDQVWIQYRNAAADLLPRSGEIRTLPSPLLRDRRLFSGAGNGCRDCGHAGGGKVLN